MKRIICIIFFIVSFFLLSCFVNGYAQQETSSSGITSQEQQLKLEDVEALRSTEKSIDSHKAYSFAYGGWISSSVRNYSNIDNTEEEEDYLTRVVSEDLRVWAKMNYEDIFFGYVRMRARYDNRRGALSPYALARREVESPNLDMGYARVSVKNTILDLLTITLGRQHLSVGRGISYNAISDGIMVQLKNAWIIVSTFFSMSKPHEDNSDYSVPGYGTTTRRKFLAAEVDYTIIPRHVIYWYGVSQMDSSYEEPIDITQDYNYDSQYYGVGLSGRPRELLKYWIEYIKEYGKCQNYAGRSMNAQAAVDAWALVSGVKYFFPVHSHPAMELEYAYGSGDNDRQRVLTTIKGNTDGDDTAFIYFGEYYGGYASAPRLTNLSIYKIDASIKPFEGIVFVDQIRCGVKYFWYRKNHPNGGIYDIEATHGHRDVGDEINFYLHWKLYANLFYSVRYGVFYPGNAFDPQKREKTTYLFNRITMTF